MLGTPGFMWSEMVHFSRGMTEFGLGFQCIYFYFIIIIILFWLCWSSLQHVALSSGTLASLSSCDTQT